MNKLEFLKLLRGCKWLERLFRIRGRLSLRISAEAYLNCTNKCNDSSNDKCSGIIRIPILSDSFSSGTALKHIAVLTQHRIANLSLKILDSPLRSTDVVYDDGVIVLDPELLAPGKITCSLTKIKILE